MATLKVTSANGETYNLQVPELDNTLKKYDGGLWFVFDSPQNFPDPNDLAARDGHFPAGSYVTLPTLQTQLKPEHQGVRRLEVRHETKYIIKAVRDEDSTLHNARHHNSKVPMPHWNFEIFQIIDYGFGNEKRRTFQIGPPAQAHVPKSTWVEIELIMQERVVFPTKRYYWDKPDKIALGRFTSLCKH